MKNLGRPVLAVALLSLFIISCVKGQENSLEGDEILLNSGNSKLAEKKYDDAREKFKELLRKFPKSSYKDSTRVLIARSYLEQENKDYAQAYIAFDRLATYPPRFQEEAMYKTAYCSKQLGRYEEALALYMDFRTRFPESRYVSDAYFDIGKIYVGKTGEIYVGEASYDLALASYDLALKNADDINPHHSKAKIQYAIGYTHYYQGLFEDNRDDSEKARAAFEKARAAFEDLLKKYTKRKEAINANYMIAKIYGEEKKWDEMINKYRSIIDNEIAGHIYIRIGGLLIKVNTIALSYYQIGQAYMMKEEFEKAYEASARIVDEPNLSTDPIAPFALHDAMYAVNEVLKKEKLRSDVQEEFAPERLAGKYISDHSDKLFLTAEAQLQFAHIQRKRKQYRKAAMEYAKLQDYKPSYTRLNLIKLQGKYYEGLCYEEDKNNLKLKEAKESYKKVTMLFKLNFQPLIDFPNIDIDIDTDSLYVDIGNRDHYISTALLYVGLANMKLFKYKEAEETFELLVSRYPKSEYVPKALLYVGLANMKLFKYKEAEETFELLVSRYPKSEYVKNAREAIEELRQELGDKIDNEMDSSDASGFYDSSEKSQTQQLTAQDIAKKAKDSTVFIEIQRDIRDDCGHLHENFKISRGSGFLVSPGQIATNFHIIEQVNKEVVGGFLECEDESSGKLAKKKCNVIEAGPVEATARIVGTEKKYAIIGYTALDADRDLAILKVRAFGVEPLKLGDSDQVQQGTAAYPIGNPLGIVNVVSDGKISSIQWVESIRRSRLKISDRPQNEIRQRLLMMTAPISPGNSGGPVLNDKGEVIGISVSVSEKGQNLNFAVPVNDLKALLEMVGPPKPLSNLDPIY